MLDLNDGNVLVMLPSDAGNEFQRLWPHTEEQLAPIVNEEQQMKRLND